MYMPRETIRYIDSVLRAYERERREIAEQEQDIILATPSAEIAVHTGPGNPTLGRVIAMDGDQRLADTRNRIVAVRDTIWQMGPDYERLVLLRYGQRRSLVSVCEHMHISRPTYARMIQRLRMMMAIRFRLRR